MGLQVASNLHNQHHATGLGLYPPNILASEGRTAPATGIRVKFVEGHATAPDIRQTGPVQHGGKPGPLSFNLEHTMKSLNVQFGYGEDETVYDVVTRKVGKQAARVWQFLQTEETRANAGPKGSPLKAVAEIMQGTKLTQQEVQESVIALAQNRLITKITADGRVAA